MSVQFRPPAPSSLIQICGFSNILLSSPGRLSRYPLHVELALGGRTVPPPKVRRGGLAVELASELKTDTIPYEDSLLLAAESFK
ncbi:MAG: hypothetical protein KKE00_08510 [Proteobacteria bacterium]|nr:hypothetical protein [Pseudomonadota bacterium]